MTPSNSLPQTLTDREKDGERLDYLIALLDLVVPAGEKFGDKLGRADVDRVMSIWPSPQACIAAMGPRPGAKS